MQPTIVRRLRESGKRRLVLIPFLFTFANAFFGLLSVLYTLDDAFAPAAYCILAAALADAFDGRIARALGVTSTIGMELDSLCDAISFCLAPAILVYCFYFSTLDILGTIAAGLFLCAGLFRLAKFNITACAQKQFFIGMPTPIAALFIALCTIHDPWLLTTKWSYLVGSRNAMMVLVTVIAYLMVSNVRFPSFKTGVFSKRTTVSFVLMMVTFAIAIWFRFPLFLTTLTVYIISSVLMHGLQLLYRSLLMTR